MRPIQFDNRPFGDVDDLFARMNRQFEEMRGQWDGRTGGDAGMPVDVAERDGEIVVTADLPGFDREDVDVTVSDGVLTITAERGAEDEQSADGEYLRRERRRAAVRRAVRLPSEIDEEAATAGYVNGVLTITLPERESEDDARRIDIE